MIDRIFDRHERLRLIQSVIGLSHDGNWYLLDANNYHTRLNATNHYTSAIQMFWLPKRAYAENDSVESQDRLSLWSGRRELLYIVISMKETPLEFSSYIGITALNNAVHFARRPYHS